MGDEAHVRLVDAHAEGDGRDHDDAAFGQEAVLVPVPVGPVHAGMVGQRRAPGRRQPRRGLLGGLARQGVDDAGCAGMPAEQAVDLPACRIAGRDADLQIRPVEAGNEDLRPAAEQPLDDVLPGDGVRRRREGAEPGLGEAARQFGEAAVIGPEIVAPLRDAVRFVDGEARRRKAGEAVQHILLHQPLRRNVEQAQAAVAQLPVGFRGLGARRRRIERARRHAVQAQRGDLVAHERDQRRDDDGQAVARQRRNLVAQRLAGAGRHDGEHILALHQRRDDLRLAGPETGEAESVFQDGESGVEGRHRDTAASGHGRGRRRGRATVAPDGRLGNSAADWRAGRRRPPHRDSSVRMAPPAPACTPRMGKLGRGNWGGAIRGGAHGSFGAPGVPEPNLAIFFQFFGFLP